jgi:hypothetical protein
LISYCYQAFYKNLHSIVLRKVAMMIGMIVSRPSQLSCWSHASTGQHNSSSKYGRRTIDETNFPPRIVATSNYHHAYSLRRENSRSRAFRWSSVCLSTKVDHIIDYGNIVDTLEVRSELLIEIPTVDVWFAYRMAEPLLESA